MVRTSFWGRTKFMACPNTYLGCPDTQSLLNTHNIQTKQNTRKRKGAVNYSEFTVFHMWLVIASRYITVNSLLWCDRSGGTLCLTYGTIGMVATCDTSIHSPYNFFKASTTNGSVRPQSLRMKLWTVQHAITKYCWYRMENGGMHLKILKRLFKIPNVLSKTECREKCL